LQPIAYRDQKWPEFWGGLIKSSGAKVLSSEDPLETTGPALIRGLQYGSMDRLKECWANGHPYYFCDSGYFRAFDRQPRAWYRIVPNSFQQNWINDVPDDRFKKLRVPLRDWKHGRDILVCPPYAKWVPDLFGVDDWLDRVLSQLNKYTDRPIRVRPKYTEGTIWEALEGCHALVTFYSNTAVDAIVAGVPVFVPRGNQASPVGLTDLSEIENPIYPDREKWAYSLAYGQYNLDEMESGEAWEIVQQLSQGVLDKTEATLPNTFSISATM